MEFCQFLECQAPPFKRKVPLIENCLVTVLPRALGKRGRQKYNYVVQKVTNVHQEKIINMMKVNETHVQAAFEKIEVRHYFRFAARRVNIFPINLNFT